jgi:hypothetical protein
LESIAQRLIEVETIEREEFEALIGNGPTPNVAQRELEGISAGSPPAG